MNKIQEDMQCVIDVRDFEDFFESAYKNFRNFTLMQALRHDFNELFFLTDFQCRPIEFEHPDLRPGSVQFFNVLRDKAEKLEEKLSGKFFYFNGRSLPLFNWLDIFRDARKISGPLAARCCALTGNEAYACVLPPAFANSLIEAKGTDFLKRLNMNVRGECHLKTYSGAVYTAREGLNMSLPKSGAVFLDRDGVLNRDYGYVHDYDNWEWIPGAKGSIKAMNDAGLYVFIVTNQSGIARGYYTEKEMFALHERMREDLRAIGAHIDAIRFCPYHPRGVVAAYRRESDWRKPGAGMLKNLCESWPIDLESSFLVGDSEKDIQAARSMKLPSWLFRESTLDLAAIFKKIVLK